MNFFSLFLILMVLGYFVLENLKVKNITLTVHQTGKINTRGLYNIFCANVAQVYVVYNDLFLFPYLFYSFIFFSTYELIWTIVGRTGLREQMGRGEVMGQLIHLGLVLFPYLLTIGNDLASQIFHYFFLVFPFCYALFIFFTKNGHLQK